jgi:hypothetical protein
MVGAFTPDQKKRMEDLGNEFHLEGGEGGTWNLFPIHPTVFRLENREQQPGEPSHRRFAFESPSEGPGEEQTLRFIATAEESPVQGFLLELDGTRTLEVPAGLRDGESLVYEGGDTGTVYSPRWQPLRTISLDADALRVAPGEHQLLLDAAFGTPEGGVLKLEIRIRGSAESVARTR